MLIPEILDFANFPHFTLSGGLQEEGASSEEEGDGGVDEGQLVSTFCLPYLLPIWYLLPYITFSFAGSTS